MTRDPAAMPVGRSDIAVRAALFLGLWLVLTGYSPLDLVIGLPAAAIATGVSHKLLPPGINDASPRGILKQIARLPAQSIGAGIEVARQVFAAQPRLRPGIVACHTDMPEGIAREAFLMLASLQPGTLPVAEGHDGTVRVQTIDLGTDVNASFGREEARFASEVCQTRPRPGARA
jgi:multisubunit Na+/H+ antiporter MnhE subunit